MTNLIELEATVSKLAAKGKGILAADESTATISKRFQAIGIESNEDSRRAYRELLMTTPGCNQYIAGVILFEETLNQKTSQGIPFPEALKNQGILPGIKVDKGLVHLANTVDEQVTQGLDGLAERLTEYKTKGACFAKWRAVYAISTSTPSALAIETNAEVLARYAALCQEHGIVPIVEPEVLIDGDHTLARCEEVSEPVLHAVFNALYRHKVKLEYIVLKPSMVINGKACPQKASVKEVAEATLRVLKRTVPGAVPTINFLSGGQTPEQSTAHLNAMNQSGRLPWNLSFSYARALQDYAMKAWAGQPKNISAAQAAFAKRAKLNSLAATGTYAETMEKEAVSHA
ncbi:Fructose-bisphosphate aldolase class 1 [Aquicella siphonis]|uniref:Probable fructose-bisphosphate aldolase class 1 n=1 Tax=Aquicella siphonis TaxID=254247 RepID=A0A5E4PK10_9COXI|nr:class I fructose-bisphosphate aldolase [Aquicella siphonis]VVC76721.1 Fructose-bisphosphate aldolase class 1 [Aquicella siphonis]